MGLFRQVVVIVVPDRLDVTLVGALGAENGRFAVVWDPLSVAVPGTAFSPLRDKETLDDTVLLNDVLTVRDMVRTRVVPPPPPWLMFALVEPDPKLPDHEKLLVESDALARVHTYRRTVTVTDPVPAPTEAGDWENS